MHKIKGNPVSTTINRMEISSSISYKVAVIEGVISAIVASLDQLYTVLIENSNVDPTAKGITLKFMVTFSYLATTNLLADILPVLARLRRRFQKAQVDFTTVTDGVSIAISTLATFKSTPGTNFEAFLSQVPSTPSETESFYYMGHLISDSQKQRNDFDQIGNSLIDKLIDNHNLHSCFPDGEIISSISVLDPQNLPPSSDLDTYGNQEIEVLSLHYGHPKNVELEPLLNIQEAKENRPCSKQMMSKNFSGSSIQGMAKKLLHSDEVEEQLPQILKLLILALTIPVSSVDCES